MKNDINTITSIAKLVRKNCERIASKSNIFDRDLSCMCAIASWTLKLALAQKGIVSKVVAGSFDYLEQHPKDLYEDEILINHCWVEVDGKIVDITATQFGEYPEVYIVSKADMKYCAIRTIYWAKELREQGWPQEQRPVKKIVDRILTKKIQFMLDNRLKSDMILA